METEISPSKSKKQFRDYIDRLFEFMSSIFAPLIPVLAGSGILKGLILFLTQLNILDEQSVTYTILLAISETIFYFLPVMLAFSASKVLGANPYLGAIIGASLLHPSMISIGEVGDVARFIGLPLIVVHYSSTVIPIIFTMLLYAYLYQFLESHVSETYKIILVPFLSLIIIVPITLLFIGPLGYFLGKFLAGFIEWLMDVNSFLTGFVVGGAWATIIGVGFNWAINPIMINNLSVNGYDYIRPFTFASNFSTLGIAIGLFLRSKNRSIKGFAGANILTLGISGIAEPMIYGVLFSSKKFLAIQFLGAALGAGYMGLMGVTANAFIFGSLLTLPALVGQEASNLVHGIIGLAISLISSAILTFVLMNDEDNKSINISERKDS